MGSKYLLIFCTKTAYGMSCDIILEQFLHVSAIIKYTDQPSPS